MKISRPFKIDLKKADLKAEIFLPKKLYDKDELVDIYIAPTLIKLDSNNDVEKPILPIDQKMLDKNIYEKFNRITYSIGKLNRLAELINDKLKRTIALYLANNKIEEILERNKKCKDLKKYNFQKDLTFGELRNVFSCIIKTDKEFEQFEELEDGEKRNDFSKLFDGYINDRDSYTHGILSFLYPDFDPILKIKPPNTEEHYVGISERILRDNLLTYDKIDQLLDKINLVWQQKR
ncbi:hypothetical protein [Gramella sp. AN32]|uniref:RNA polymerase alpha subunit n=1 Tax=Christiangramia antarctica TaxID=2058158 RepID=A0ABW5X5U8_9FLAO|nr:hypothetical protein [Gramella sp. AN32]MCM4157829.1 hypothetical protein [Gramella sp. AN32]